MISVEKISNLINGEIIGDETYQVKGICDIEKGKDACITYLSSEKYIKYLKNNNASVFIIDNDFKIWFGENKNTSWSFPIQLEFPEKIDEWTFSQYYFDFFQTKGFNSNIPLV